MIGYKVLDKYAYKWFQMPFGVLARDEPDKATLLCRALAADDLADYAVSAASWLYDNYG